MAAMGLETDADDITVKRDEYVEVVFGDGRTCRFDLLELRRNCPCAECRNVREAGDLPGPHPRSIQPLRIDDAQLVGGWGLGVQWSDGHNAGIYSWELLRRWCEAAPPGR